MTNHSELGDRKEVEIEIDKRHLCRSHKNFIPDLVDEEVLLSLAHGGEFKDEIYTIMAP